MEEREQIGTTDIFQERMRTPGIWMVVKWQGNLGRLGEVLEVELTGLPDVLDERW